MESVVNFFQTILLLINNIYPTNIVHKCIRSERVNTNRLRYVTES